jgi:signal transduction histidine kinase
VSPANKSLRRALVAIGIAGFISSVVSGIIIFSSDLADDPAVMGVLTLIVSWSFLATGLYTWDRRPDNLIGPLMVAGSFAWSLAGLGASDSSWPFAVGMTFNSVPFAFVIHMIVVFPSGKVKSGYERFMVSYAYAAGCVVAAFPTVFLDTLHAPKDECTGCPANPLLITSNEGLANAIFFALSLVSVFVLAHLTVHMVRRARSASAEERRRNAPVWWAGAATLFLLGASLFTNLTPEDGSYDDGLYYVAMLAIASVPYAFWAGLVRSRLGEAAEVEAENVRLDAELQARLDELRESRARIVEAGYTARRQLERDLHDGAQQRLVALALDLRLARSRLPDRPEEAAQLLEVLSEDLARATEELRTLARGIHPAVLSDRGLSQALDALASRAPLPVAIESDLSGRLPERVEAAAYFVVSEALTNVSRHAAADRADVGVHRDNGSLVVEVRDNGRGGADPQGSGLRGLADRVAALDGRFEVRSAPGGTTIRATLPVRAASR